MLESPVCPEPFAVVGKRDDDRVVVHFGTDEEGLLVALDVDSGEEVWSLGKDGASYASPFKVELNGVRQIVEWNHLAVVGVESASGRRLWEYPFPHDGSNQNMPSPIFHRGRVIVGGSPDSDLRKATSNGISE